ncbi:MAG: hypothetical protein GY738_14390 [Pseudoalteromonas sp.]|nr:hypothetical protein [Pseudoalteromonas sp.]
MNDLEICKRIAEMKKIMPTVFGGVLVTNIGEFNLFDVSRTHRANKHARYVLDLMLEFKVCICHYTSTAYILSDYTDKPHKAQVSFDDDDELSFRRSVLLAIIEAHNEQ